MDYKELEEFLVKQALSAIIEFDGNHLSYETVSKYYEMFPWVNTEDAALATKLDKVTTLMTSNAEGFHKTLAASSLEALLGLDQNKTPAEVLLQASELEKFIRPFLKGEYSSAVIACNCGRWESSNGKTEFVNICKFIDEIDWDEPRKAEIVSKTGRLWSAAIYEHNPVGFYLFYGGSLTDLIKAVNEDL